MPDDPDDDTGGVIHPTRMPEPTRVRPGTPGRIDVYAARYANAEHLYHPDDADDWSDWSWGELDEFLGVHDDD